MQTFCTTETDIGRNKWEYTECIDKKEVKKETKKEAEEGNTNVHKQKDGKERVINMQIEKGKDNY